MKKILGSLLLVALSLCAKSEYEWKIHIKDSHLYVNQATVLTMQCKFSKEGKNDDVEFSPPKDVPFAFELLSEKKHFDGELQTLVYEYLVFAKKEGLYEINLHPVMLFTTQSAIDNVIEGRDNVNDLEVQRQETKLDPIEVHVSKTSSSLTGTLTLKTQVDLSEVSAYEPVHLEIFIEGEGNLQSLKDLRFEIEGVQVFADKIDTKFELCESGYKGVWLQRFAFVGTKDFSIPSLEIRYFDLKDKQEKILKTLAFEIKIKEDGIKREDLVDKINLPSKKINYLAYINYIYYILIFLAGFMVAKLVKLPSRQSPQFKKGDKIKKTKNAKDLLELLIICDRGLFKEEIDTLEKAVYKDENINLKEVKKNAGDKL